MQTPPITAQSAQASTSDLAALRDQFERAYAAEWAKSRSGTESIDELVALIQLWRDGDTYGNDLPRLQFGWEGFQWAALAGGRGVLHSTGTDRHLPSETVNALGIPTSCGKPLCSPGEHHPLCKLAVQPADVLPCDVIVGGNTFRKGVSFSTFVAAAQSWHQAAYPDIYTLTDEQKAENLGRLTSAAGDGGQA